MEQHGSSYLSDPDFLAQIPKTDVHVHLDGSLRLATLIELARAQEVELPSYTEEGMKELVFKSHYNNLVEYLKGFAYTCGVMTNPESLERVSYELAWDNINEGVRYIEPRFAPQLHMHDGLDMEQILLAVDKGLARAKAEHNRSAAVIAGEDIPFEYGIIVCAMRHFSKEYSPYYRTMFAALGTAPKVDVFSAASLELARSAVMVRDTHGIPIVGFDLAGEEDGYPAGDHLEAFSYAHKHFLKKTVHAGEAYGPESIFQAISELHADRIGHGTFLFNSGMIRSEEVTDRGLYVEELAGYIADRRITIEVCLTSNLQTYPAFSNLTRHPFREMMARRLSTTLCTDNRLVSNTTVTREISLAVTHFNLTPKEFKNIVVYGFKRSFFSGSYREKREYVRRALELYERIEDATRKRYGLESVLPHQAE